MPKSASSRLLFIAALCVSFSTLHAGGIDCGRNLSVVESLICQEPRLLEADASLEKQYVSLKKHPSIIKSQKAWLETRNECQSVQCLRKEYAIRIGHLKAFASGELKGLDCDGPTNSVEMNYCRGLDVEIAEGLMNLAYEEKLAYYSNKACKMSDDEIACEAASSALQKSQEAWMAYRDSQCNYLRLQNPYGAHGGMQDLVATNCSSAMTWHRWWELENN